MHLLPQLRKLQEKYSDGFHIIGIHSAKFLAESFTNNVIQATQRYRINYPVINDNNHEIWKYYGIKAWPTTLIIDAEGSTHSYIEGEISFEELEQKILEVSSHFPDNKLIERQISNTYDTKISEHACENLCFPGNITSDSISQRLFIADSNNNRILVTSLEGKITDRIGMKRSGFLDGDINEALFNNPQGIANHKNVLLCCGNFT